MANSTKAFGLKPLGKVGGAYAAGSQSEYEIAVENFAVLENRWLHETNMLQQQSLAYAVFEAEFAFAIEFDVYAYRQSDNVVHCQGQNTQSNANKAPKESLHRFATEWACSEKEQKRKSSSFTCRSCHATDCNMVFFSGNAQYHNAS